MADPLWIQTSAHGRNDSAFVLETMKTAATEHPDLEVTPGRRPGARPGDQNLAVRLGVDDYCCANAFAREGGYIGSLVVRIDRTIAPGKVEVGEDGDVLIAVMRTTDTLDSACEQWVRLLTHPVGVVEEELHRQVEAILLRVDRLVMQNDALLRRLDEQAVVLEQLQSTIDTLRVEITQRRSTSPRRVRAGLRLLAELLVPVIGAVAAPAVTATGGTAQQHQEQHQTVVVESSDDGDLALQLAADIEATINYCVASERPPQPKTR